VGPARPDAAHCRAPSGRRCARQPTNDRSKPASHAR
jgi:hypothetical protein